MKTMRIVAVAALAISGLALAQDGQPKVDSNLPPYASVGGISGNLSSVGSDTLANLVTYWGEAFKKFYPNVNIQMEAKGSSTAPPALIKGLAQIGPMSRPMKSKEIDDFESKFGYKPTEIKVAVDALAVYIHKDNPLRELTLTQLDSIFSKSRRRGGKVVKTWGDVGLSGEWADKPISLYGRNSASGTYGFFKENALQNGDYKDEVKEQPGSASVVLGVAMDRYAIGYSGVGYSTSAVRTVALSEGDGKPAFAATATNAYSGDYPLWRYLFAYVNRAPNKPTDPLTQEFVRLILSKEGQEIVVKDGFFPLPASTAMEGRKQVD
jgi:phosphate transport system substrate-binding protein